MAVAIEDVLSLANSNGSYTTKVIYDQWQQFSTDFDKAQLLMVDRWLELVGKSACKGMATVTTVSLLMLTEIDMHKRRKFQWFT